MNYIKDLDKQESRVVLGSYYFDLFVKTAGQDKQEFISLFYGYLDEKCQDDVLAKNFAMISELCSLSFVLYKWSMLLVNLKAAIFADLILLFSLDDRLCYVRESNASLELLDIKTQKQVLRTDKTKSHIMSLMLFLYSQKNVGLKIFELDSFDESFFGSFLSFNEDYAQKNTHYVNYIDKEYKVHYKRLQELQEIFVKFFKG